jgi:hypothetical protein
LKVEVWVQDAGSIPAIYTKGIWEKYL